MRRTHVAIIGAGPAGISAAIQLTKECVPFTLFEKNRVGGLLHYANRIDNLIGHLGKSGPELCALFQNHLVSMGIVVRFQPVNTFERDAQGFWIQGEEYSHAILATGTTPNTLDIPRAYYYIDDPRMFLHQRVLIIGGGDLAFDHAVRFARCGVHTSVLVRGMPKANEQLVHEVEAMGVSIWKGDPAEILVQDSFYEYQHHTFDSIAVFIGRKPNRSLITALGEVAIHAPSFNTNIPGLYIIGDAALGTLSQTALASGSGLVAAMHLSLSLRKP